MKKTLFIIVLSLIAIAAASQVRPTIITGDTVIFKSNSIKKSTLQILNATKDSIGFLFNTGNGITEFRRALKKINDSTYLVGADTLKFHTGGGGSYTDTQARLTQTAGLPLLYNNTTGKHDADTSKQQYSAVTFSQLIKHISDSLNARNLYWRNGSDAAGVPILSSPNDSTFSLLTLYSPSLSGITVVNRGDTLALFNLDTVNVVATKTNLSTFSFKKDTTGVENLANRNGKFVKGGKIYLYADSYGISTGATVTANGWPYLLSAALGAELINFSSQGTSMEKRVPINLINSPNMVDDTVNIPVKGFKDRLLIIARATNDVFINSANYNYTNYIADGTTVLNNALSKGWDSSQILLLPPYWMGSLGFTYASGITGTPAATIARQDSFVNASRQLARNFNCLWFDIRQAQRQFDTTNIMSADAIHPNDTGHAFIAAAVLQYLNLQAASATGGLQTLENVVFTTVNNITNSGTSWQATSGSGYGATGLSNLYLRSGQNGRITMDGLSGSAVLGFNSVNALTGFAGMEAAIVIAAGNYYKVDNGTLSGPLGAANTSYKYCVYRNGSTFKLQYSTNNMLTWFDLVTLTYTSSAAMYIVTDINAGVGTLFNPQVYQDILDVDGALIFSNTFSNSQDGNNLIWDRVNKRLTINGQKGDSTLNILGSLNVSQGVLFSGLPSGASTDSIVTINSSGTIRKRNASNIANLGNSDLTQNAGTRTYTFDYANNAGNRILNFGKGDYSEKVQFSLFTNKTNGAGHAQIFSKDSIANKQISVGINAGNFLNMQFLNIGTTNASNYEQYPDSIVLRFVGVNKLRYNFNKDTFSIKGIMPVSASSSDSVFVRDANGVVKVRAQSDISGGGGSMVYPAAGIALSTGSAWGTSIADNSANWNNAFTDRLKWDGGATGLVAATGRTSLGLVIGTDVLSATDRRLALLTVVGTDANITAVAGTAYNLPPSTLTAGRNIDMTNVNTNGDYVEFYNNETGFVFTFTGQTVYDSDGVTTVTELLAATNSVIRRINGKLMISKL